jgi:hypothetical protein
LEAYKVEVEKMENDVAVLDTENKNLKNDMKKKKLELDAKEKREKELEVSTTLFNIL